MVGSWSDHARIGPALEMTFHLFLEIFFEILQCHFSWQAQYLVRFIVNDVSYVTTIKHANHSVWQPQYLVRLDGDTGCSAHCK